MLTCNNSWKFRSNIFYYWIVVMDKRLVDGFSASTSVFYNYTWHICYAVLYINIFDSLNVCSVSTIKCVHFETCMNCKLISSIQISLFRIKHTIAVGLTLFENLSVLDGLYTYKINIGVVYILIFYDLSAYIVNMFICICSICRYVCTETLEKINVTTKCTEFFFV